MPSGVPPIVFENYQLREEVYIEAAREAGMMDVEFRMPMLMLEGWREPWEGYLEGWAEEPHCRILVARKGDDL